MGGFRLGDLVSVDWCVGVTMAGAVGVWVCGCGGVSVCGCVGVSVWGIVPVSVIPVSVIMTTMGVRRRVRAAVGIARLSVTTVAWVPPLWERVPGGRGDLGS